MICSNCNADNLPMRMYCAKCGNKLGTIRHICGFINEEQDKFCGGCGQQLIFNEEKSQQKINDTISITLGKEIFSGEDIKNILEECSEKISSKKASLTQEEIEKLFKE